MIASRFRLPVLLALAAACGAGIAWVDTRPGWDDTGITAFVVFGMSALFAALAPSRAWLFALAVGGWIPTLGLARHANPTSLLALGIAGAGALAGVIASRIVRPAHERGSRP